MPSIALEMQVVGMTATVGVGNSRTVEEAVNYITRICACLDCRIISTVERHKKNLQPYINKAEEGRNSVSNVFHVCYKRSCMTWFYAHPIDESLLMPNHVFPETALDVI